MDSACAIGSPNTYPLYSGFLRWIKRHLAYAQLRPGPSTFILKWPKWSRFLKSLYGIIIVLLILNSARWDNECENCRIIIVVSSAGKESFR